jgi:hypothetical protein
MVRVSDLVAVSFPGIKVMNFLGDDAAPTAPPAPLPSTAASGDAAIMGIGAAGAILVSAGLVVAGMYYWKTAPKVSGFWKGWGYYNGTAAYLGAGVYALAALGLGGAAVVSAVKS